MPCVSRPTTQLKMKSLSLFWITLWAPAVWGQSFLHLTAGQSYSYEFSSVPFVQHGGLVAPGGGGFFYFSSENSDPANQVLVEIFESNFGDAPLRSQVFNNWFDSVAVGASGAWQDLQGGMRLTVLSGAVDLSGLEVRVFGGPAEPFDVYGYGQIIPVPEPSSILLMTIFVVPLIFRLLRILRSDGISPGETGRVRTGT